MRRKGLGSGKGKGYKNILGNDSGIHSMSSKGIKQSQKMKCNAIPPPPPPIDDLGLEGWKLTALKELSKEEDDTFTDVREENDSIELEGGGDYLIFENEEDAERFAIERVKDDLENEPYIFDQNWLSTKINEDILDSQLQNDAEESSRNYYDDIESESDSTYDNRLYQELIEGNFIDEEDILDEKGNLREDIDENKIESATEKASESMANDEMRYGGLEYLKEFYDEEEAMKKAIEIGGIDYDSASQDAVDTDGIAHFLSGYDGNQIDLKSGAVAYRTN